MPGITLVRSTVGGYLTYSSIQTKIQQLIDDDDSEVLSIIQTVINLVYDEIMARYRGWQFPVQWLCDYDDTLSTTTSTRETALATADKDVERILKVSVSQSGTWYPCTPVLLSDLEETPHLFWNSTRTRRPERFFHKKTYNIAGDEDNSLLWFDLPDAAYSFRYWFEKRIGPLSLETDSPQLPKWAHPALIYGSLVQLSMFDVRVKAGPWSDLYGRLIGQLDEFSKKFMIYQQDQPLWGA